MNKFDNFAVDLFNKIRGRFPNVSIGDENGKVTNVPKDARFFDFGYMIDNIDLGKVSVALDEENGVTIIVGKDIVEGQVQEIQDNWYNFLKELRIFAKKRMLKFDVRDINKSNLNKRDYEYLAQNRPGENTMSESKMYGNETRSYQKIGKARIAIKHSAPINVESSNSRTSKIGKIYIESPTGERFKYPYKHLAGARAMALHVNEGGHMYDDFGKYISGLSEEMSKLRKFSQYMNRSSVMAETLEGYTDIVKGRIKEVRQEIQNLQKLNYYKEASENYEVAVMEEVPTDVSDAWVDQLTIKQFNEELKDVFPYIYNLVGEGMIETVDLDNLDESGLQYYTGVKKHGKEYMKKAAQAGREGASQEELGRLKDKYSKATKKKKSVDEEFEAALESLMGQFTESKACNCDENCPCGGTCTPDCDCHAGCGTMNEAKARPGYCSDDCCGADVKAEDCTCAPTCEHCDCNKDKKEAYSPGDENEEGMVSNCCGAPIMDVYDGHGRCSDCKEMASAVPESDDDTMDVKVGPQGMEPMDKAEPEEQKTPIGEFILSYFDRENGTFPKGETAVLTMVEKDYGPQYVEPAAKFIKKVESIVAQRQATEQENTRYPETELAKKGEVDERSQFEIYRNSIVLYDPASMEVKKTYPMTKAKAAEVDAKQNGLVAIDGANYMELVRDKKRMAAQDTEKQAELPLRKEPKKPGALDRLKSLAGLN